MGNRSTDATGRSPRQRGAGHSMASAALMALTAALLAASATAVTSAIAATSHASHNAAAPHVAAVVASTSAPGVPSAPADERPSPDAGKALAAASSPPREAAAREPLDAIRERLAAKLGSARPGVARSNTLRVVSKEAGRPRTESAVPQLERPAVTGRHAGRSAARPAIDAFTPTPHPRGTPHWDYTGATGPADWSALTPEFATCASGSRQSPIDIRDGLKVELEPVRFDYRPSAFGVIDNGHTVQVNLAAGNAIEVGGRRFELLQFHFHRPSEERIDGKQFAMTVHLVHKSADGRLAVVAVLLERGPAQPTVQTIWNDLPLEKGEEVAARTLLNPADLLPGERRYFTYMGSLTTPPCSEGVLWMVLKQPVTLAAEQEAIFARLYPMNARPVQPLADRLIKESN